MPLRTSSLHPKPPTYSSLGLYGIRNYRLTKRMLAISPSQPRPQTTMFRRLFSYLGGENQEGQKMEMTTPVWTKLVVSDEVTDCTDEIIIVPQEYKRGRPVVSTDDWSKPVCLLITGFYKLRQGLYRRTFSGNNIQSQCQAFHPGYPGSRVFPVPRVKCALKSLPSPVLW